MTLKWFENRILKQLLKYISGFWRSGRDFGVVQVVFDGLDQPSRSELLLLAQVGIDILRATDVRCRSNIVHVGRGVEVERPNTRIRGRRFREEVLFFHLEGLLPPWDYSRRVFDPVVRSRLAALTC